MAAAIVGCVGTMLAAGCGGTGGGEGNEGGVDSGGSSGSGGSKGTKGSGGSKGTSATGGTSGSASGGSTGSSSGGSSGSASGGTSGSASGGSSGTGSGGSSGSGADTGVDTGPVGDSGIVDGGILDGTLPIEGGPPPVCNSLNPTAPLVPWPTVVGTFTATGGKVAAGFYYMTAIEFLVPPAPEGGVPGEAGVIDGGVVGAEAGAFDAGTGVGDGGIVGFDGPVADGGIVGFDGPIVDGGIPTFDGPITDAGPGAADGGSADGGIVGSDGGSFLVSGEMLLTKAGTGFNFEILYPPGQTSSGTFTFAGTNATLAQTCPTMGSATIPYSFDTVANTLTLYFTDYYYPGVYIVETFTLEPGVDP